MHYTRHYIGPDRSANDAAAIEDIREYMGDAAFEEAVKYAESITPEMNQVACIQMLNRSFAIATSINGYPFHAFCRRYCLDAYRAWMHDGADAVLTDEAGFPMPGGG